MSKKNPETDRVILLITRGVRAKLRKFCDTYRTADGFNIRMGEFGDVAIIEKLERMKGMVKKVRPSYKTGSEVKYGN